MIAAVNGPAVGIGTTLLLHCDLVFVGRNARLKMPFVNLGLTPEFGSSLILPRMLGHARAAELLMLGQDFSGEQAAAWGLANAALEDGATVLEHARDAARRFLHLAPSAVVESKRLMKAPFIEELRRVIAEEAISSVPDCARPRRSRRSAPSCTGASRISPGSPEHTAVGPAGRRSVGRITP